MSPHQRRPDSSLGGLLGVVMSALVILSTVWGLPGSGSARLHIVETTAGAVILGAILYLSTLPRRWSWLLAGYPLLIVAEVGLVGWSSPVLSTAYLGLITIAFVYVGLAMPRGSGIVLVPFAVLCWWECNSHVPGAVTNVVVVRQIIGATIWVGLAELLARRARDQERGRLRRAATRDPLTGLDNRTGLDTLLESAAAGDAFVLLDLDHFKDVNDEHGHAIGDLVLTDFAGVVSAQLRRDDSAIRYGGEEVLLHLPRVTLQDAGQVIDRIRQAWSDIAPLTTFSAGAAAVLRGGEGRAALIAADKNLYRAKAAGRNCAIL
jgi:diguanylate cyclase (GGDEF)-like protein